MENPYEHASQGPPAVPPETDQDQLRLDVGRSARILPVTASAGFLGLVMGIVGLFGLTLVTAIAFTAAGVDDLEDDRAFMFVATFLGDLGLVAAALLITARMTRPTPELFGFRRCPLGPAIGWAVLAFFTYIGLTVVYTELVNPPQDELPDQLGRTVLTAVFVMGIAPVVEEFFFRGFLFQSLRNTWGPVWAVLASAAIFSAIHFDIDKFVPLVIFGTALAFVFHKTESLWPCIALHAVNNALAFLAS
jgi:membrane protease YdiL (CAAX protease family)